MSDLGEALGTQRRELGMTVEQVAFRMGIPADWVRDLEAGRLDAFGNEVHASAAVRLYAGQLDLDADELLAASPIQIASTGATFEPRIAHNPTRGQMLGFLAMQAQRSPDSVRYLSIIIGLELLAGVGALIVKLGG